LIYRDRGRKKRVRGYFPITLRGGKGKEGKNSNTFIDLKKKGGGKYHSCGNDRGEESRGSRGEKSSLDLNRRVALEKGEDFLRTPSIPGKERGKTLGYGKKRGTLGKKKVRRGSCVKSCWPGVGGKKRKKKRGDVDFTVGAPKRREREDRFSGAFSSKKKRRTRWRRSSGTFGRRGEGNRSMAAKKKRGKGLTYRKKRKSVRRGEFGAGMSSGRKEEKKGKGSRRVDLRDSGASRSVSGKKERGPSKEEAPSFVLTIDCREKKEKREVSSSSRVRVGGKKKKKRGSSLSRFFGRERVKGTTRGRGRRTR